MSEIGSRRTDSAGQRPRRAETIAAAAGQNKNGGVNIMERKKIYLASPTMHGDEQAFVQNAFDTNWVAPLGPHVRCV